VTPLLVIAPQGGLLSKIAVNLPEISVKLWRKNMCWIGGQLVNHPLTSQFKGGKSTETHLFFILPCQVVHSPKEFLNQKLWETYGSQHIVRTYVTYLKNTMFDSWNWNDAVGLFNGGWGAPNITMTGGTIMIQPEFYHFFLHQGMKGFLYIYIKKNCRKVWASQICGHLPISGKMWFFWNKHHGSPLPLLFHIQHSK
jgi:hypothetical protein